MKEKRLVLQWNMGCRHSKTSDDLIRKRINVLESLLKEMAPSLVAVQEAPQEAIALLSCYDFETSRHKTLISGFSKKEWTLFGMTNKTKKVHGAMGLHISNLRGQLQVVFWNVHLLSRMWAQEFAIRERAYQFRDHFLNFKKNPECVNSLEIIAGDFNLWPYDAGITYPHGLYASRSLMYASEKKRKYVPASAELPLYNPAWCLFGLSSGPLGSFYSTSGIDGPWYLYDQILMSPEIADRDIDHSGFRVISLVNKQNLCSKQVNRPDPNVGSDHLPVVTSFAVT